MNYGKVVVENDKNWCNMIVNSFTVSLENYRPLSGVVEKRICETDELICEIIRWVGISKQNLELNRQWSGCYQRVIEQYFVDDKESARYILNGLKKKALIPSECWGQIEGKFKNRLCSFFLGPPNLSLRIYAIEEVNRTVRVKGKVKNRGYLIKRNILMIKGISGWSFPLLNGVFSRLHSVSIELRTDWKKEYEKTSVDECSIGTDNPAGSYYYHLESIHKRSVPEEISAIAEKIRGIAHADFGLEMD